MAGKKLKLVSWNVNGLRAVIKKEFLKSFKGMIVDFLKIFCLLLMTPMVLDVLEVQGEDVRNIQIQKLSIL